MAVFGIPRVHEDDALRAVRAAAEIREALAAERGARARAGRRRSACGPGSNTGEVVAGDGDRGQRLVTGDAVNVAARLEQAAAPGEILIGARDPPARPRRGRASSRSSVDGQGQAGADPRSGC